ncbi:expressed unknown protein [Seminavis robusta]|uniref:Uncharacterized protein n=1 Tax=Seminavis robusta TaxID=568900 RepID=A0A9N8HHZ1_9STRA|nr:expressed unknown protein [Seminavis robusta]|eukprot:Sro667_g184140.1 n/a (332) ;mRNA; f:18049-19044
MAPPSKRPKIGASQDAPQKEEAVSWMSKCVAEFKLNPIPTAWKCEVPSSSETQWKRYYYYRKEKEQTFLEETSVDRGGDDEAVKDLLAKWHSKLRKEVLQCLGKDMCEKWLATISAKDLCWEDADELRSATFEANVWSPFAMPHAIKLQHRYHHRARSRSVEFYATWAHSLLDFAELGKVDWEELCSNCYEDEELRMDVIDTENLTRETVDGLRRFLHGTDDGEKLDRELFCNHDFMLLLFASMGTIDYETIYCGDIGYAWRPPFMDEEFCKAMVDAEVFEAAHYIQGLEDLSDVSWLDYGIREASGELGPMHNYYKHPTIKDAVGYKESL